MAPRKPRKTATMIGIANQKGGVGKTTTVINLAAGLARRGKRILMVDLDHQSNIALFLGLTINDGVYTLLANDDSDPSAIELVRSKVQATGRENLFLLASGKKNLKAQNMMTVNGAPLSYIRDCLDMTLTSQYDYILLDTPPGGGGMQERGLFATDYLFVVAEAEFGSLNGVTDVYRDVSRMVKAEEAANRWKGKLVGILPTKFTERFIAPRECLENLKKHFPGDVLEPIHSGQIFPKSQLERKTVYEVEPNSLAVTEFDRLVDIVLDLD